MLKYCTWHQHQVKEENLQALLVMRAAAHFDAHVATLDNSHHYGQGEPSPPIPNPVQPEEQVNQQLQGIEIEAEFEVEDDVFDNHFDFPHINTPGPELRTLSNPDNHPDLPVSPLNPLPNQDCLDNLPPPALPPLELDYDSDDSNVEWSEVE
ncbi:hypothetical protein FRC11_006321 [Ceratobasidium sp. 423]|nr:hypothetical protein FRC11_006321 [Ceratobasidium sp. 423]